MNHDIAHCYNCKHFHINYEPMKHVDLGRASCDKHNLIVDFLSHRQLKRLTCVEDGKEE